MLEIIWGPGYQHSGMTLIPFDWELIWSWATGLVRPGPFLVLPPEWGQPIASPVHQHTQAPATQWCQKHYVASWPLLSELANILRRESYLQMLDSSVSRPAFLSCLWCLYLFIFFGIIYLFERERTWAGVGEHGGEKKAGSCRARCRARSQDTDGDQSQGQTLKGLNHPGATPVPRPLPPWCFKVDVFPLSGSSSGLWEI